jgi:hypothetical protein
VNKALKWLLSIIGAMALMVGLLWFDSVHRATRGIDAIEEQVRHDILDARSRPTAIDLIRTLNLTAEEILEVSPLPNDFDVRSAAGFRFEEGNSGQYFTIRDRLNFKAGRSPSRAWTMRQVMASLVVLQLAFREAGTHASGIDNAFTKRTLLKYRDLLCADAIETADLRTMVLVLEHLEKSRLTEKQILENQRILDRMEVLHVFRARSDPLCFVQESPCWRELYSWRILTAKSLLQVSEGRFEGDLHLSHGHFFQGNRVSYMHPEAVDGLAMARVATSIRLFQTDKARMPASLSDLVPEYLPAIPSLSAQNQKPLSLEANFTGTYKPKNPGDLVWPIIPR